MTNNEAIEILKERYLTMSMCGNIEECKRKNQAISEAITALNEIQQYRSIGTVEECREVMERQNFTEDDISQIKFALEYLHDVDLSNYGEENIKALESVMRKLGMDFIEWDE